MTTLGATPGRPPAGDFIPSTSTRPDALRVAALETENLRLQGLVAELLFTNQKLRTALESRGPETGPA